eukprot:snap_masked-scaffold_1-processed-gene-2.20-mRNA-1 protein AED:1.00 eAED:1.00 QI:0/-1/0/0/-1/1/1/0/429
MTNLFLSLLSLLPLLSYTLDLQAIPYDQLVSFTSLDSLPKHILTELNVVGAIAVSSLPGMTNMGQETLEKLSNCLQTSTEVGLINTETSSVDQQEVIIALDDFAKFSDVCVEVKEATLPFLHSLEKLSIVLENLLSKNIKQNSSEFSPQLSKSSNFHSITTPSIRDSGYIQDFNKLTPHSSESTMFTLLFPFNTNLFLKLPSQELLKPNLSSNEIILLIPFLQRTISQTTLFHKRTKPDFSVSSRSFFIKNEVRRNLELNDEITTLDNNGFCSGQSVSMYMAGFTSLGNADEDCLVFFFRSWVMDSRFKFGLGAAGSVLLGGFSEFIVFVRGKVTGDKEKMSNQVVNVFLYGLQQGIGYLAMFIAMTYSVALFILIVVGLTLGHWMFNFTPTKQVFTSLKEEKEDKVEKYVPEEKKSLVDEDEKVEASL